MCSSDNRVNMAIDFHAVYATSLRPYYMITTMTYIEYTYSMLNQVFYHPLTFSKMSLFSSKSRKFAAYLYTIIYVYCRANFDSNIWHTRIISAGNMWRICALLVLPPASRRAIASIAAHHCADDCAVAIADDDDAETSPCE